MTVVLRPPPVTTYQREAIFCPERSAVIEATTKAGKTMGCLIWIIEGACNDGVEGSEFWWVAPIYEQTKIAYRRMKRLLRGTDQEGVYWKANDSDLSITLQNGRVMRFKSADKPDGLYGEDVYRAVIDEASRCKEEAWHAVRSTLTATNGAVRIIGNVKGRKNWAYALARKVESGALPGWRYAKITARDAVAAGIISAEQVASAKRELPEHVFRELYEAEPSEDGANPFGLQHIAACVKPMSALPPVAYGADLAKSIDFTVVVGLDGAGVVCGFDRWQHVPWSETERRLLARIGNTPAMVDSTGVGDPVVEGMQRSAGAIEGFKFTSTSKQQLMEGLVMAIQQGEVGFPDGPIRHELEAFEYEHTRTGVRYSAPEGQHDDCVCALALAVERRRTVRRFLCEVVTAGEPSGTDTLPQDTRGIDFGKLRENPEFGFTGDDD